jgi:hypothetical protein
LAKLPVNAEVEPKATLSTMVENFIVAAIVVGGSCEK